MDNPFPPRSTPLHEDDRTPERPRKRLLFVDDEPGVLQSLQRMLRAKRGEWDMTFVDSGAEALARLAGQRFDVLVTDMRMPGVDGMELLTRVRAEHPHMVRIVLSGYSELEEPLRALPLAHQFLAKPCDAETLALAVDRAARLEGILGDPRVRDVIGPMDALPSVPRLCSELDALIADPDASLLKVARLIEQDPAMVATVLQIVNASSYGLPRRVVSVREATTLLGLNSLRNLVLSVAIFRAFVPPRELHGFSIERLQAHSFAVAQLARCICPRPEYAEDAFVSALLADVGQLVLATREPRLLSELIEIVRAEGIPLHEAERARLGVSHAEIGARLLGEWQLPYSIVESVAFHHETACSPARRLLVTDSAAVAHALLQSIDGAEQDPFDVTQPPADELWFRSRGVGHELAGWRRLALEQRRQVR